MSHGSGNESSDDDGIWIEQETVSHLLAEVEANDLISEDVKNELEKLMRTLSKGNVQSSSLIDHHDRSYDRLKNVIISSYDRSQNIDHRIDHTVSIIGSITEYRS
eukprot:scaffold2324_cov266-Pinguiococcus_pyrenoidosus.AAC.21